MCWQVHATHLLVPCPTLAIESKADAGIFYSCGYDEISWFFCGLLQGRFETAAVGAQNVMRLPVQLLPTMKLSGTTNIVALVAIVFARDGDDDASTS